MRDDENDFTDFDPDEVEEVKEEKPKAKKPRAKKKKLADSLVEDVASEAKGLDEFGLRVGTIRSKAAALYARDSGATLAEVKDAVGIIQYNVLTQLEKKGFTVETVKEAGANNRTVTRYFLRRKPVSTP